MTNSKLVQENFKKLMDEVASLRERNFILYSHVEALNRALDSLCPLVARTIDWLPSEQFTLRASTREALDNVTYIQNKEYRETNLDYYKDEPDFDNMPIEKINQYLREHGYKPEAVGLRGKILVEALTKNIIAREIILRFLDDPHGCRFCDYGVLRKPGIPEKDHDEDCLYLAARAYLDNETSVNVKRELTDAEIEHLGACEAEAAAVDAHLEGRE